ncbi:MAG: SMI1/KNR4 family protein [Pirellulales bacterium]|nr:SMI1/KNR4 family protein [Pirellulales bacterium]
MDYQELRARLQAIDGTQLTLTEETNAGEFGVPDEYIEFLRQVGYGRIGNSQFQFFDGVVFVDEIFGYETPETENVLIFGDDYQGVCTGFDKESWGVVRVLHDQSVVPIADSFESFVSQEF